MPFVPIEVWTPLAQGTVTSGGTTAPTAGTSQSWTVTAASAFPAAVYGAQHFYVSDPAASSETIEVTVCPGGTGSGQAWTVTRGADGTTPVTHAAGFTIIQVAAAQTLRDLQDDPWQFFPENYGAKGDGIIGKGGTGSSGSPNFSDAAAAWTSADAGKAIIVNQGAAGSATNPFVGTISSVTDATHVVLSGNLTAATSSAPYVYGTDDQPAIQAAVNAASTFAQGANGNWQAEIVFRPAIYMLKTLTQQSTGGGYNTHIAIPYGTQTGRRLAITLTGTPPGCPQYDYWLAQTPDLYGTCLVSAVFPATQPDATYGQVSIIGSSSLGIGGSQFANGFLCVNGITLVPPWNAQMWGVDGRYHAQMDIPEGLYHVFAPVNLTGTSTGVGGPYLLTPGSNYGQPGTNGNAVGYAFPVINNNAVCRAGQLVIVGAGGAGIACSEHTQINRLQVMFGTAGIRVLTQGGTKKHMLTVQHYLIEGSTIGIDASGMTSGDIIMLNITGDSEYLQTSMISDSNNCLRGLVHWSDSTSTFLTVTGGKNLIVIDDINYQPGPWSGAPAAPSSGTAQQNTSYRYATIYARATTSITSVAIGPASGSMTSVTVTAGAAVAVPVRVPPGWYWSATYSGTLTAPWWLD